MWHEIEQIRIGSRSPELHGPVEKSNSEHNFNVNQGRVKPRVPKLPVLTIFMTRWITIY